MSSGMHAHEVPGAIAPDVGGVAMSSFDRSGPGHTHMINGQRTGPPIGSPQSHTHATPFGLSGPPVFRSDLGGGVVVDNSDDTINQMIAVQPGNAGPFQPFFPTEPGFEEQFRQILRRDTHDQDTSFYPIERLGSDWGAPDQTFIFGTNGNSPSRRGGDGRVRIARLLGNDQALPNPDFNWGDDIHAGLIFEDYQRSFRQAPMEEEEALVVGSDAAMKARRMAEDAERRAAANTRALSTSLLVTAAAAAAFLWLMR